MARRDPLSEGNPESPEFYEPLRRPGRQPSRPQSSSQRLRQLICESEQWARRCEEVWFDHERKIDMAYGMPNTTETLERYDEAILAFREVAKWAAVGKKKLTQGRKIVQNKLPKTKPQGSVKRQKKT